MKKQAVIILLLCLAVVGCGPIAPDVLNRKFGEPIIDIATPDVAPTLAASPVIVVPTAAPPTVTPSATVGLQQTIDALQRHMIDITAQAISATENEADRQLQYVLLTEKAKGTQDYFTGLTETAAPTELPKTATQAAFERQVIIDNATGTAYAPTQVIVLADSKNKADMAWFYNLCDALWAGGIGISAVIFSVTLLRIVTRFLPVKAAPISMKTESGQGWQPIPQPAAQTEATQTPAPLPQGWLPATPDDLLRLAKAVKTGKSMVFTNMAGPGSPFSRGVWQNIRQRLLSDGYAQLINPRDEKSAIEFTAKGDQLMEPYLAKVEAIPQNQGKPK